MDMDNPKITMSPLSRSLFVNDQRYQVNIFRAESGWTLKIVDETNIATIWDEIYSREELALAEALLYFRQLSKSEFVAL